jgi:2-succinyl-6-hydroxy-2,4-cyclohexadiene-1-carboxylate synthase
MSVVIEGPPEGIPYLLVHGFTGAGARWGRPLLEGLAEAGLVRAVDLPGHGPKSDDWQPDDLQWDRVVDGLVAELDEAGIRRAHWIGYSMGGRLALAAALTYPERVATLTLESASPGLETARDRAARRARDEALAQAILERGVPWFVDFWASLPLFRTQAALPAQVLERIRQGRLAHSAAVLAASLRGLGTGTQPSYWPRLGKLAPPTLLLSGAKDRKFEALARQMTSAIPRATHRSIPGAGHTLHLEAPQEWADALRLFTR